MIQKSAFLLIFLVLLSQTGLSQPKATVQITGGYTIPLPDLAGTFGPTRETMAGNGNPDSNTYFMKAGPDYGFAFKFPINRKKLPLNIVGTLLVNSFLQDKEYTLEGNNYIKVEVTQNITTIGGGIGYSMAGKKTVVNPYVDFEIMLSLFTGHYTEDDGTTFKEWKLSNTVRGGIQATAGIDYVLHNNVGATVGVRYSFANIIGKNAQQDTQTKYYLNDAERTDQGVLYPARNIRYLQLFGGVSFYFGR